jgi:putative ABC transport system ATP-binding protein
LPKRSVDGYAVETIELSKIYRIGTCDFPALQKVNIKIKHGEFVAIVGPSGSGKSTLLNMLGALDRPNVGNILIDGIDLSTLNDNALAKLRNEKIGFVFQAYNLINRTTAIKNIELPAIVKGVPRQERLKRAQQLLDIVGLGDKADRKPSSMSGGEQQRVAVARALINDPTFILADEPTGNLDSKSGDAVFSLLKKTREDYGTTLIMVTHNLELAEAADRIIHLKDGMVDESRNI